MNMGWAAGKYSPKIWATAFMSSIILDVEMSETWTQLNELCIAVMGPGHFELQSIGCQPLNEVKRAKYNPSTQSSSHCSTLDQNIPCSLV